MALSASTRSSIASLVQQKRSLQQDLRNVRSSKKRDAQNLSNLIRQTSDRNTRNNYRNQKTRTNESYNYRIDGIRNQINSITESIRRLRG